MEEQFELASLDPVLSTAGHDDGDAHRLSGPRRKQRKKKQAYITPTSGAFIPFKNGKTELNAGILHLYREMSEIEDVLQQRTTTDSRGSATEGLSDQLSASKGTGLILCVLAVPSYMTPQDFLSFVGSTKDNMSHLRMLRDSLPNRYMVLVKFRDQGSTDAFYRDFNGREFSALASEVCHVVYIKSVEFKSQAIPPSPVRSPTSNQFLELPTCPVCLDRMDASATGLLTIFCHHTFHCHCLSKWGDSSCPVCRYSSQRALSADADESSLNECVDCGATENLWICLICGNIGCGRYQAGHAQRHYVESDHLYAMELETQRVWDYAGDGYVHRLIQNRADGKLVELSAPTTSDMMGPNPDGSVIADPDGKHSSGMVSPEKLESLGLEYTYLLTSQLESQRLWYESRLSKLESMLTEQVSQFTASFDQLQRERDSALQQRDELQNQLAGVERDSRTLQSRLTKVLDRVIILEKDLRDERALNKSLLGNQTAYATQITEQKELVKKKDEKIQDLEEQVHDLMAFVEMRKQVEEIKELEGAQTIGVAPAPQPSGRGRKGKGRK
ncbi:BRCA1-associated protein 2-domain-containing protein [Gaertneriomyces semiglobifer]|nr:BRCA1-associated protein 2-domain-containing protein [Gaertneriomyces semiglobifer]